MELNERQKEGDVCTAKVILLGDGGTGFDRIIYWTYPYRAYRKNDVPQALCRQRL